jgi:phosphoribosylformylglycinamidine (FGAM) synthase-like enzyme/phosphoribosylformylglycinamidine (FGAM) synthase PurS component
MYQIEVRAISEQHDVLAHQVAREILQLPGGQLPSLAAIAASTTPLTIRTAQLYYLTGNLTPTQINLLTRQLLIDTVIQEATVSQAAPVSNTYHIVDVFFHPGVTDTLAESVLAGASMLGITTVELVETGRRYLLDKRLSEEEVRIITQALLYNPVIQHYVLQGVGARFIAPQTVEGTNADVGARFIAPQTMEGTNADVGADLSRPPPIYRPNKGQEYSDYFDKSHNRTPTSIPLLNMTNDQLLELSKTGLLSLNLDEMRAIQQHYREQGREPADVELETLAQTWSEHCSHKTFKATIHYRELDSDGNLLEHETINGLLRQYIMQATHQINRPWVVSAFSDNAGIIRFTESHDIAFKVETHNHPSAIEPFGGANTGVGGVIRDVLGVSAQPIACTDILCFGPPDTSTEALPAGVLSPHRIAGGVVNGVRDYGNKMGIPTVNGAILYNERYIYNPLVFCGCLGILPRGSHPRQVQPGDRIVVLGGRTGRDGIHGATFSSGEMSSEINAQAGSAVQIGAPITEKKVADVIIQARDRQLYSAITDCGAGGFSSAIGEMGAETGAHVELEKVPLKYQGLAPWEIWLSEAQERMVLAVPPENLDQLLEICAIEEVEASIIGTFTANHRLVVNYHGQIVANLDMALLHNGRPGRTLEAVWVRNEEIDKVARAGEKRAGASPAPTMTGTNERASRVTVGAGLAPALSSSPALYAPALHTTAQQAATLSSLSSSPTLSPSQYTHILLSLLSHPTIASKEAVVRRYDHEVQGATILKPFVGRAGNGPGDAAVLQPILDVEAPFIAPTAGIILTNGINPLYGRIDPYHMAINAVDEALRNLAAVGGDIEHAAILDNFCWGNPADPLQLGMLVRAVKGCHDAAIGYGTPFISGKDSLNNEYRSNGERLPVIPTLLISAVGVIDDAAQTIDMSLKQPGNLLYQIGITRNELAGSHYLEIISRGDDEVRSHSKGGGGVDVVRGPLRSPLDPSPDISILNTTIPHVNIATARTTMKALGQAIRTGLVQACHDLSEGGLAIAAAEMSLAGLLGMTIDIGLIPLEDSPSVGARFIAPPQVGAESQVGARFITPPLDTIPLFSESASRFLVEIAPEQQAAFEAHMHVNGVQDFACIGNVTGTARFILQNGQQVLIDLPVGELQAAWRGGEA